VRGGMPGGEPLAVTKRLRQQSRRSPSSVQHAIVERVDRLLAMVDQLEQQVAERKVQAEELMQAVLREAFG
jgi:hypothetical protein